LHRGFRNLLLYKFPEFLPRKVPSSPADYNAFLALIAGLSGTFPITHFAYSSGVSSASASIFRANFASIFALLFTSERAERNIALLAASCAAGEFGPESNSSAELEGSGRVRRWMPFPRR
jgi:hypothetical protein